MSIRPVDLQVLIPKATEVGKMNQEEMVNREAHQNMNAERFGKRVQQDMKTVVDTNKTDKKNVNPDDKNKAGYSPNKRNKTDSKNEKEQDNNETKSSSLFDVKI